MNTPAPPNMALQTEDDKGDGQRVVMNIDDTPPSDRVPTPAQHDEDVPTQRPEVVVNTNDDRPERKKAPSTRYPSETYNLRSARLRRRKSIMRAR